MGPFVQDLRYAFRALSGTPVVSAVIVLTLMLGIGMNTAIFSVVNGVLLKPLDYSEAGELAFIGSVRTNEDHIEVGISGADFRDLRQRSETLEDAAAIAVVRQNLTGIESPQQADVGWVSGNTFAMLGVRPELGRVFDEGDPPGTIVLGYEAWQTWFGGDPEVLGTSVNLDERPHTIVGVLPARFRLEVPDLPRRLDIWKNPDNFSVNGDFWGSRDIDFFRLIGRRAEGASLLQVREELGAFAAALQSEHPNHAQRGVEFTVTPLHEVIVGDIRPTILALFGAVGLVLLIACANVVNLLLARAETRRREIAVRVALGSSRPRIVQLLLVESGVLALLGGAGGVAVGFAGTALLNRFRPPQLDLIEGAGVDGTVLGFAAGASMLCVLLFGLAPALGAAAVPVGRLSSYRLTAAGGARRFSRLLVACQIALSLVLLIGAGLLAASLARLQEAPAGFVADDLMTFSVSLPSARYPDYPADTGRFFSQLDQRLEQLPNVVAAGLVWPAPLSGRGWDGPAAVRGVDEDGVRMDYALVTSGYFAAAETRLLEGRTFAETDPQEVVLVNQRLAERAWPGESAIGRVVTAEPWGVAVEFEVIGVVEDVRNSSLREPADEALYFDSRTWSWADWEVDYVVRTAGAPLAMVDAMRAELAKLDPAIPLARPREMRQVVADELAANRFGMSLLALFAGVASLLAAVGLYGVRSCSVGSRRREIGIRMALGSDGAGVLRMVMGQGVRLALLGLGAGWLAAVGLSRFLASLLYEVEPVDAQVYGFATILLAAVAVLSAYVPARRATGLDPITVLRPD